MEELERQMASKEAETGGVHGFWRREIFGSGGFFFWSFFWEGGRDHGAMIFTSFFGKILWVWWSFFWGF